jgi:hypothetical protein
MVHHTTYRKRLMSAMAVIVGGLFMGGCLPVSVQVASLVIDGVSYIATEKTVAEHGLSAVTGQDCAVLKGIQRGSLCVAPDEAAPTTIAKAEPAPAPEPLTVQEIAEAPAPAPAPAPVEASMVTASVSTTLVTGSDGHFYVIGSRFGYEDALSLADAYDSLDPTIVVTSRDGRNQFDIVVGPFAPNQKASLRERIIMAGVMEAWTRTIPIAQWRAERFGRS